MHHNPKPIKSIKITRGIDARASYSKAVQDDQWLD